MKYTSQKRFLTTNNIILYTENVIKLGSAIHKLVRIVNYQAHAEHYTSFVQSTEDNTQWFYENDTSVSHALFILYDTIVFTTYKFKVTPVSTVTFVQQDPFMLFYTLHEVTVYRIYIHL